MDTILRKIIYEAKRLKYRSEYGDLNWRSRTDEKMNGTYKLNKKEKYRRKQELCLMSNTDFEHPLENRINAERNFDIQFQRGEIYERLEHSAFGYAEGTMPDPFGTIFHRQCPYYKPLGTPRIFYVGIHDVIWVPGICEMHRFKLSYPCLMQFGRYWNFPHLSQEKFMELFCMPEEDCYFPLNPFKKMDYRLLK
jgi:hypothetical protein